MPSMDAAASASPIFGANWGHINFRRKTISLYRPKTGTADLLDLHPAVAAELTRLRDSREDVRPDDHVFLSCRGTPFVENRAFIVKFTRLFRF